MTSHDPARDAILAAVRAARPSAVPRPRVRDVVQLLFRNRDRSVQRFMNAACQAGAEVVEGDRRWAVEFGPDAVVCDAVLGVAENGAVWLPGARIRDRAGLLLAEHVVVILDRAMIVDDLHTAYARINIARDGFGMFMAGPSKTADIEQSLVIGAQGPKGLTILVVAET